MWTCMSAGSGGGFGATGGTPAPASEGICKVFETKTHFLSHITQLIN